MRVLKKPLFLVRFVVAVFAVSLVMGGCAGKQYSSKRQGEGEKLYFAKKYDASAAAYKKAAEEARKAGDARDEAHLRSMLGWAYAGAMDFESARAELKEAVRIAESTGVDAALFNARLAAIDSKSGDLEEGLAAAEKALVTESAKWITAAQLHEREPLLDFAIANHGGLPPDMDMIKTITIAETSQSVMWYLKGDFKKAVAAGEAAVRHFESLSSLMTMAPSDEKPEFYLGKGVAAATVGTSWRNLGDEKKMAAFHKIAAEAFGQIGVEVKDNDFLSAYAKAGGYRSFTKMPKGEFKADSKYSKKFNEAESFYASGHYTDAITSYRVAIDDARAANNVDEAARASGQLGWLLAELGRYPEAIRLMEQGIGLAPEADYISVTYARLSAIEGRLGNYDKGLRHANMALVVLYKNRTMMFEGKDRDGVIDAAMKNPGLPPDMVLIKAVTAAEGGKTTNLYLKKNYAEAIKEGERALGHFNDISDAVTFAAEREQISYYEGWGFTTLTVGDSYLNIGQVQKGRGYLERSRGYFKKARLNYGDVIAEALISYSYLMEGDYAKSAELFKRSRDRIEEGGLEELKWHIKGMFAKQLYYEARQLEKRIATLVSLPGNQAEEIAAIKSDLLKKNKGRAQALEQLIDSDAAQQLAGIINALEKTGNLKDSLAQISLLVRFFDELAYRNYLGAMENLESIRSMLETDMNKRLYQANKQFIYEDFIELANRLYGAEAGFNAAERAKARGLMDLLAAKEMGYKGSPVLKEEKALRESIAEKEAQLRERQRVAASEAGGPTKHSAGEAEKDIDRYRGVVLRLKKEEPELASFITAAHFKYQELEASLPADLSLVEYYPLEDKMYIWVADRQGVWGTEVQIGRVELKEKVLRFRDAVAARDKAKTASLGGELGKILLGPLSGKISGKRLCIIPTGFLHLLPFAALNLGEGYLADKYPLSFAPSASVLKYAMDKNRKKGERLLVFANPDLGNPAYDLPAAAEEARRISSHFKNVTIYSGKDALKERAITESPMYDVIHFASHGEYNEISPLFSSLRLAAEPKGDGRLEAGEIFSMDIKPYLVTLSACQTGVGTISNGDEVVGMNRAFIYAGSPSVIASLWSVSDVSTAMLMDGFYANLRTMSKDEALRRSQIALRKTKEFAEPFFWAPFYITGDWR